MAKIPFSDVTPPDRRSIRNIPIPNSEKRKKREINLIRQKETEEDTEPQYKPAKKTANDVSFRSVSQDFRAPEREVYEEEYERVDFRPKKKRWILFIIIFLILAFVVAMMTVFASATIIVEPKSEDMPVSLEFKGGAEISTSSLRYEVIRLSEQKQVEVDATGEEMAEVKASGRIKIYNNFSAEPQRLIVRTRFETKEGLIYRIPESTTVPGKTATGPGSIEVEIFADEAGEKYNVDKKTLFTIPGFKNEPERYQKFYAEAVTDISYGFVGKRKMISANAKETALAGAEEELKPILLKDLTSKVPEGLVLLSGSVIYEAHDLPQKEGSSKVIVGKEVMAYAILLNKEDLSNKIISEYVNKSPEWEGILSQIKDYSALEMTKKPESVGSEEFIGIAVEGKVRVVGQVDSDIIKGNLAGKPKEDAGKLIDQFEGISSITATIRPLWKQSFPANLEKLHVKIAP